MPKLRTLALAAATTLFVVSARARVAEAQPNYPTVIRDYLGAVRKPPCKVCHVDGITGFGTAGTNFAKNMKVGGGLRAYDEDSVRASLDNLILYPKDSSGLRGKHPDDIEVLRRGGDPNDANPIYLIEDPQYGCGGATFGATKSSTSPALAVPVIVLAIVVRRRRRRPMLAE